VKIVSVTAILNVTVKGKFKMGKFQYQPPEKAIDKKPDEFRFEDVQTKNPRLSGKTPIWLYNEESWEILAKKQLRELEQQRKNDT